MNNMSDIKDYVLTKEQKEKVAKTRERIALMEKEKRRLEKVRLIQQKKSRNNSEPFEQSIFLEANRVK